LDSSNNLWVNAQVGVVGEESESKALEAAMTIAKPTMPEGIKSFHPVVTEVPELAVRMVLSQRQPEQSPLSPAPRIPWWKKMFRRRKSAALPCPIYMS
jgi:hypothetical protein